MDPVAATGIAYVVETAVEAAAIHAIAKPTVPPKVRLRHLSCAKPIPRSSHTLSIVGQRAYLFGGEIQPRQPVSNDVEVLRLPSLSSNVQTTTAEHHSSMAKPSAGGDDSNHNHVPAARVGHSAAAARDRVFIFGGRGGPDMTALQENGRLWVYDTEADSWLYLDPPPHTDHPPPRSYHASTASSDGSVIFIHAGCSSAGPRLSDTWAFYLDEGKWTRLADAPGPARGGTSLTFAQGKLWRFGGFDGKTELGGQLDYLDIAPPARRRTVGLEAVAAAAAAAEQSQATPPFESLQWKSLPFGFETREGQSDTVPGNRSLAALHPISTGQGREYLLLALGEAHPSSSGHAGAGKFCQDIWCYQLPPASGASGAGVKDAIRERLPGMGTSRGQWAQVEVSGMDVGAEEEIGGRWTGRGWFASSTLEEKEGGGVLIWGGIDETNQRLGDGWLLLVE